MTTLMPTLALVRSRVTMAALVLSAFAAGACRSTSPEPETPSIRSDMLMTARLNEEIGLPAGATLEIIEANLRIRIGTFDDSRCPTKALIQCVWAGSVRVQLVIAPISGAQASSVVTLETVAGKDVAVVQGKSIRLMRVTPEKEGTEPIPAERYRFFLRVTNAP